MKVTQYRTQLFLDEERYLWLKRRAVAQGTSIAQVVRKAVDGIRKKEEKMRGRRQSVLYKKIMALSGSIREKGGVTDVSVNHDKYLGDSLYEEIVRNRR